MPGIIVYCLMPSGLRKVAIMAALNTAPTKLNIADSGIASNN
jgi:hypothetical protein